MSRLSSYFLRGLYYLNYINNALDGHQIHSPYVFNLYSALIKNNGSRFKPRKIHQQLLNLEEINASIASKKTHQYIADLVPHLGLQSLLYVHYDSGSHSKNVLSQIKFISTRIKETTWVSTGVASPPTQKSDLNEKKFKIDPKASFFHIINRDLYEMVILDISWIREDLSDYLTLLSSIHQPPKAILFLNIHLNPQNHQSWKSITNDAKISLTIDLFHIGLVFLNLKMEKQHFVLKS